MGDEGWETGVTCPLSQQPKLGWTEGPCCIKDVSGGVVFLRWVEGALCSPGSALQVRDRGWGSDPSSIPPCLSSQWLQAPTSSPVKGGGWII